MSKKLKRGKSMIIIPAHLDSTRLPGKVLRKVMIDGKEETLLSCTYRRALQVHADHVMVAASDPAILSYCKSRGINYQETGKDHPNGTSRCEEAFRRYCFANGNDRDYKTVVNWQADEPLVEPNDVRSMMVVGIDRIATLVSDAWTRIKDIESRDQTKVVVSRCKCHWFSRQPMAGASAHIGVYAFSPFLLKMLALLSPSELSKAESLEQLTWIEHDFSIYPVQVGAIPLSINSLDDWNWFKETVGDWNHGKAKTVG